MGAINKILVLGLSGFLVWNFVLGNPAKCDAEQHKQVKQEQKITIDQLISNIKSYDEDFIGDYMINLFSGETENYVDALTVGLQALEHEKFRTANIYNNIGWATYNLAFEVDDKEEKQEMLKEALKFYTKALELDPEFTPAYNNLGGFYVSQRQYEKAIEIFEKGIQFWEKFKDEPNASQIFRNCGGAYFRLGKSIMRNGDKGIGKKYLAKAIKIMNICIEVDPESESAEKCKGTIKRLTEKYFN